MRATLLGTGSAWPIPRPGCACPQCDEARADPRERRTRSGLFLETAAGGVLVDASPDVIWQLERAGLTPALHAVVITHHHRDHAYGIDDLWHVLTGVAGPLTVYAGPETQRVIRAAFPSLFASAPPAVVFERWTSGSLVELGDAVLEGFETGHRDATETTGVLLHTKHEGRAVRVAYATDMGGLDPSPREALEGVDLFLGDGTFLLEPGHGHPLVTRTIAIARGLSAGKIVLTHVGHWGVSSAEARSHLPEDVAICRDGDDLFSWLA